MLPLIFSSQWTRHHAEKFLKKVSRRKIRISSLLGLCLEVGRCLWTFRLVSAWISLRFCQVLLRIILGLLALWNRFLVHRIFLSCSSYFITTNFLIISNCLLLMWCYYTFVCQHWRWIIPKILFFTPMLKSNDVVIAIWYFHFDPISLKLGLMKTKAKSIFEDELPLVLFLLLIIFFCFLW